MPLGGCLGQEWCLGGGKSRPGPAETALQLGVTVRDSKFGSPNGPFKKGLPASLAARTHTPALTQDEHAQTPFQHGKAQATHN